MDKIGILFFVYNRPEKTRLSFDAIRLVKPSYLIISSDGAKNLNDQLKVNQVREIVKVIDWPCEVKHIYHVSNIGCRANIISGIDYAFEQLDKLIVVEDDIIVSADFIRFCVEMLKQYEHHDEIYSVCGFNGLVSQDELPFDGYFSKRHSIWGWATWKRAWLKFRSFDLGQTKMIDAKINAYFDNSFPANLYTYVSQNEEFVLDNWETHWDLFVILQNGFSICPSLNLIQNIGFDAEANRTKHTDIRSSIPIVLMKPNTRHFTIKSVYEEELKLADEAHYLLRIIASYAEPRKLLMMYKAKINASDPAWAIQLEPFKRAATSITLLKKIEKYIHNLEINELIVIFERAHEYSKS